MADDPTTKHKAAVERAEAAIQRILLDLEEETGASIDGVEVDTRNFSGLHTDIWLAMEPRA